MTTSAKRAVAACVLLAGTSTLALIASPAAAQEAPLPPTVRTQSPLGVDLNRGSFVTSAEDISIGVGSFPERLSVQRVYDSGLADYRLGFGNGWTHSLDIKAVETIANGESIISVNLGLSSMRFRIDLTHSTDASRDVFSAKNKDGSRLERSPCTATQYSTICSGLKLTTRDGAVLQFSFASNSSNQVLYRLTTWTAPNGNVARFQYLSQLSGNSNDGQLLSVINGNGLALFFSYGDGSERLAPYGYSRNVKRITSFNFKEQYCDRYGLTTTQTTSSNKCNLTGWPTVTYAYAGDQLTSVTSPAGKSMTYAYDAGGNLLSTVSASGVGQLVRNVYDPTSKKVVEQYDDANRKWSYGYQGSTTTLTDPLGESTATVFTAGGKPLSVTNPLQRTRRFEYDADDRLTKEIDPEGGAREYVYLLPGADPATDRGNVRRIITRSKNSADLPRTAEFEYPDTCTAVEARICNRPTAAKAPIGGAERRYHFTYDAAHGGLVSVKSPADTSGAVAETRFRYDRRRALIRSGTGQPTSGLGRYKTSTTSETGLTYPSLDPFYVQVENSSCSAGTAPECVGTSREHRLTSDYDGSLSTVVLNNAFPRSTTVIAVENGTPSPDDLTTTLTFDRIGNLILEDGPRLDSDISSFTYDDDRRVLTAIGADPDDSGALTAPVTQYGYDGLGRQNRIAQQNGASWLVNCRRHVGLSLAREWGAAETGSPDACPSEGDPVPAVDYAYDAVGRLATATQRLPADQGGDRVSAVEYFSDGRVRTERIGVGSPDEQAYHTFSYTADGLPETVRDARGNLTTYEYNGFGELARTRYPHKANGAVSSQTDAEGFAYDANGNLDVLTQRDGTAIRFAYDALDRVVAKDVPEADRDVSYTYDLLGRMTTAGLPGANAPLSVSWSYDKLGRLDAATSLGRSVEYAYSALIGSMTMTFPDGKSIIREFDTLGRATAIFGIEEPFGSDWRSSQEAVYSYDQLSRRTGVANGNGTRTNYAYDALGRLGSLGHDLAGADRDVTMSLGYNRAGQIALRGIPDGYAWDNALNMDRDYQVNPLDQYSRAGPSTPTYDGRGNLSGNGRRNYAHDSENRLTGVGGQADAQLSYDAIGRLARITGAGATIELVYDGEALIAEYDGGSGALLRRYVHGPGVDEPILWYEGAGHTGKRWLHADERGSVVAGSGASGASLFTNSYGPFGEPGKVHTGRFGYTGQLRLPGTGLYHYKARAYSPTLGRFLQTDPIGTVDDHNLYAYVGNDPVNFTDASGLQGAPASNPYLPSTIETARHTYSLQWHYPSDEPLRSDLVTLSALTTLDFSRWIDRIQIGLDVAGFLPGLGEPFDLLNAGIYALRGDWTNAALSTAAVAPIVGSAATIAKASRRVNVLGPVVNAPHTVFKRDATGRVSGYTQFDEQGRALMRFRGSGGPHGGQQPPLVLVPRPNKALGSRPVVPRAPYPSELPRGY